MSDLINPSAPFFNCFLACIDRQTDPFQTKVLVQFSDRRCAGLIDQRMIDIADGGAIVDTGITIDGENLLEP